MKILLEKWRDGINIVMLKDMKKEQKTVMEKV